MYEVVDKNFSIANAKKILKKMSRYAKVIYKLIWINCIAEIGC